MRVWSLENARPFTTNYKGEKVIFSFIFDQTARRISALIYYIFKKIHPGVMGLNVWKEEKAENWVLVSK